MRLIALVCLFALVFASLAAPSHRHEPNSEVNCLICHAAPEASLSIVSASVVEPGFLCAEGDLIASRIRMPMSPAQSFRTPRAPPLV